MEPSQILDTEEARKSVNEKLTSTGAETAQKPMKFGQSQESESSLSDLYDLDPSLVLKVREKNEVK